MDKSSQRLELLAQIKLTPKEKSKENQEHCRQVILACIHTNSFPKQVIKQPICTHSEDELIKIYQEKNKSHQTKLISSFDNARGG